MIDEISDPEDGQTRLARAQHLTRTSQAQILLGDAEAILGLAHAAQARFGGPAEPALIEKKTSRLGAAPADPPAQLMELRQAETFGILDHHHRRFRNVDTDLD